MLATRLLKTIGLTFNGYLNLPVKQLINQRCIPFEIVPAQSDEPNETTRRAMVSAEAKELGLIPDDGARFDNVHDAMRWLDEE